jgi:hypothetical protein
MSAKASGSVRLGDSPRTPRLCVYSPPPPALVAQVLQKIFNERKRRERKISNSFSVQKNSTMCAAANFVRPAAFPRPQGGITRMASRPKHKAPRCEIVTAAYRTILSDPIINVFMARRANRRKQERIQDRNYQYAKKPIHFLPLGYEDPNKGCNSGHEKSPISNPVLRRNRPEFRAKLFFLGLGIIRCRFFWWRIFEKAK